MVYLLPILVGIATVLQASMNRQMSLKMGMGQMAVYANFWVLVYSILIYFFFKWSGYGANQEFFKLRGSLLQFEWWYLIPPALGLLIVLGLPYAMTLGTVFQVIVMMVATQVLFGMGLDFFLGAGQALNWKQVLAALMAVGAVVLSQS